MSSCIRYKYVCSLSNIITLLSFLQVLRYTQNICLSKAKCFVLLVEYKYSFFGVLYFKKPNELWSHFPLLSPKSSWMSRKNQNYEIVISWCVPLRAMKTEEMWNIFFFLSTVLGRNQTLILWIFSLYFDSNLCTYSYPNGIISSFFPY